MTPSTKPGWTALVQLVTNDIERSRAFYRAVLGWELDEPGSDAETTASSEGEPVATFRRADALGGAAERAEAYWLTSWPVDDLDAAITRAATAEGTVLVPPTEIDGHRFAVVEDPAGATVGLYEGSPTSPAEDHPAGRGDEPISSLASRFVISVEGRSSLRAVVGHLVEGGVGFVVVDDDGSVAGVVSEHDIIRAIHDGAELDEVWATDVMSTDLVTARDDEPVLEVARRMAANRVRHVLVFGDRGGVVSIRDVIEALVA